MNQPPQLPRQPKDIPYRYAQLRPRWKARTASWTDDQWHRWRLNVVSRLIRREKVISQRELESRVSDFVVHHTPRIEPHHISAIKQGLDLVTISDDPVPFYTRRKMRKLDYAAPLQRKQRLHRNYLEIATTETCGSIGEKVTFASIEAAAQQNPALSTKPHHLGNVSEMDGLTTTGSLDTFCYYLSRSSGLERKAIPLGIEVKNIREWIYPESQELWQTIRAATELNCIPVLVTRRIHLTTASFCKSVGMAVFETQRQYFAPHLRDDTRLFEVYRDLHFRDVIPWDDPDPYITKFFSSTLPSILDRTVDHFARSTELLHSYAVDADLHSDDLPHERRTSLFAGFRADFLSMTREEQVGW